MPKVDSYTNILEKLIYLTLRDVQMCDRSMENCLLTINRVFYLMKKKIECIFLYVDRNDSIQREKFMIQERVKLLVVCFCRNKYTKTNDLASSIYNNRSFVVIGEKRQIFIHIHTCTYSYMPIAGYMCHGELVEALY